MVYSLKTKHLYPLGIEKGEVKEAILERIDHPWTLPPRLFAIRMWSPHIQPLFNAILLRKQQGYGINGINQERHKHTLVQNSKFPNKVS